MSKTQKNFVKGAAILAVAGLICKVIGAVFRIPLANIIGELGMGNYQLAYPIYALLLVVSTAGLPTAISKMVSERVALGDYRGAHYIFKVAFRVLLIIGISSSGLMMALSEPIARLIGQPTAVYALLAIGPALFFVSVLSAYRGYFQGMQMMTPTASTQLVEQIGKLLIGLTLAAAWIGYGPEYGAAGALVGVTASEIAALALIMGFYRRKKRDFAQLERRAPKIGKEVSFKSTVGLILKIAVPVTLGACIMPLVSAIDSAIVIRCLTSIKYSVDSATSLFGMLTGYVNPLINMPAVLSLALAMSLVPAISSSKAERDLKGVKQKSSLGFRLALLVGLPCALGFFVLSEPILKLLYHNLEGENLKITVGLLQTMSLGVLFLTMVQTMTGILQGLGKVTIPVINLLIGAVVKVAVSLILIRIPEINIQGAAIGTLTCYAVAAVLDVIMVIKYSKFSFKLMDHLLKPLIASGVMTAAAYYGYNIAAGHFSNTVSTLIAVVAAVAVYAVMLFLIRALNREDMDFIPGGGKITKLMLKLHFWR